MDIDRRRVLCAFAACARPYDARDAKVRLKICHTYRVAGLCERIAVSLGLPKEDILLAWLCGMLHDIGRFEQLRLYGTFNDAASIDHARAGAQALFGRGLIRGFVADSAEDDLLQSAVSLHNAYCLPSSLPPRAQLFCQILRDADKVDILRVNVETPLEQIYNVSSAQLRQSPLSPAVLEAFYAHHTVLNALKKYPADRVLGHASLVFGLCYEESLRAVAQQGYLWQLLAFSSQNPATAAALAQARAHLRAWLDARIAPSPLQPEQKKVQ